MTPEIGAIYKIDAKIIQVQYHYPLYEIFSAIVLEDNTVGPFRWSRGQRINIHASDLKDAIRLKLRPKSE